MKISKNDDGVCVTIESKLVCNIKVVQCVEKVVGLFAGMSFGINTMQNLFMNSLADL